MKIACPKCKYHRAIAGRAFDGRRAYCCHRCGYSWTAGTHNRTPRYSKQRQGFQFANQK